MTAEWFYARNGQMAGPLTADQLRQDALAGKVTGSDHVRRGANGTWVPASKVKGLFDPAPPAPTPPPRTAPISRTTSVSATVVVKEKKLTYKVLTQKDKWLSQKFDPVSLEKALNSYGQQGWRVRTGDTASFPGFLSSNREELITILERDEASDVMEIHEYKVLTQKDKWYSGKFDPERLERAKKPMLSRGGALFLGHRRLSRVSSRAIVKSS